MVQPEKPSGVSIKHQPSERLGCQFYSGQFIDDVNDDGVSDWLVANGGDPMKQPDEERDTGYLMILSGANGQTLGIADLPDGRETYMSPLLYTPHPDMATEVIYGSGGETWDGSLWSTSIDAIMDGDISASVNCCTDTRREKGLHDSSCDCRPYS